MEKIIALRYFISMLGCQLEPSSLLLGDNMAVVLNTTIPSSALKKKHQACNYHKVRESIAGGFIKFAHIRSEENLVDLLTKPLSHVLYEKLTNHCLFRKAKTTSNQVFQANPVTCNFSIQRVSSFALVDSGATIAMVNLNDFI